MHTYGISVHLVHIYKSEVDAVRACRGVECCFEEGECLQKWASGSFGFYQDPPLEVTFISASNDPIPAVAKVKL